MAEQRLTSLLLDAMLAHSYYARHTQSVTWFPRTMSLADLYVCENFAHC
jgi:hypothetical protein